MPYSPRPRASASHNKHSITINYTPYIGITSFARNIMPVSSGILLRLAATWMPLLTPSSCLVLPALRSLLQPLAVRPPALPCATMVAAGAYSSDDWDGKTWEETEEEEGEGNGEGSMRWLKLGECDVLLPPAGTPLRGLVHFVGGALVGVAPRQAYSHFLETMARAGGVGIVATPCTGLTGLDHWAAASEVMLRWCAAREQVYTEMRTSGWAQPEALPVVGVGHSLGAKLLVLLGSDPEMLQTLQVPCFALALHPVSPCTRRSHALPPSYSCASPHMASPGLALHAGRRWAALRQCADCVQ